MSSPRSRGRNTSWWGIQRAHLGRNLAPPPCLRFRVHVDISFQTLLSNSARLCPGQTWVLFPPLGTMGSKIPSLTLALLACNSPFLLCFLSLDCDILFTDLGIRPPLPGREPLLAPCRPGHCGSSPGKCSPAVWVPTPWTLRCSRPAHPRAGSRPESCVPHLA